jgi:hypothetical protein
MMDTDRNLARERGNPRAAYVTIALLGIFEDNARVHETAGVQPVEVEIKGKRQLKGVMSLSVL